MKKVLVLYYSQSGQLKSMVDNATSALRESDSIKVDYKEIIPKKSYPYPWPFYEFFDAFPEAVFMKGCEVEELEDLEEEYDLIILGYTIWYLSPSIPITGFMKSDQAQKLFKDKPVITLIACRDMWVLAQEKMKTLILDLGARLIDNAVLTDQGGSVYAFITTPRWMLTGKKDPFSVFPAAGVSEKDLQDSARFGIAIAKALEDKDEKLDAPLLRGMGAVNVNGKLIASEKIGTKSFSIWGKLVQKSGNPGSFARKIVITLYAVFLFLMVLTIVPLNIILKKLLYPFRKEQIEKEVAYYEQPSGR